MALPSFFLRFSFLAFRHRLATISMRPSCRPIVSTAAINFGDATCGTCFRGGFFMFPTPRSWYRPSGLISHALRRSLKQASNISWHHKMSPSEKKNQLRHKLELWQMGNRQITRTEHTKLGMKWYEIFPTWSSFWSDSSSTGVTTSTRRVRLRVIISAEPM